MFSCDIEIKQEIETLKDEILKISQRRQELRNEELYLEGKEVALCDMQKRLQHMLDKPKGCMSEPIPDVEEVINERV